MRVPCATGSKIAEVATRRPHERHDIASAQTDVGVCSPRPVRTGCEQVRRTRRPPRVSHPEARLGREHVNGTAHGIAAVLRARRSQHGLHARGLRGIDPAHVLIRTRPKRRVVETDAIDQVQHLIAREPPEKRRGLSVGTLLDHDPCRSVQHAAECRERPPAVVVGLTDGDDGRGPADGVGRTTPGRDGDCLVERRKAQHDAERRGLGIPDLQRYPLGLELGCGHHERVVPGGQRSEREAAVGTGPEFLQRRALRITNRQMCRDGGTGLIDHLADSAPFVRRGCTRHR